MDVSITRDEKRVELIDRVKNQRDIAEAFDMLADFIDDTPIPRKSWEPIWDAVKVRLRADAKRARQRADEAEDRVLNIEAAARRREEWQQHVR